MKYEIPSDFYQSCFDIHYSKAFLHSAQNESILNEELQKEDITDLFLCGLATDVCVGKNLVHSLYTLYTVYSVYIQGGVPSMLWNPDTGR